jgi:multidrug resistance efflux pump
VFTRPERALGLALLLGAVPAGAVVLTGEVRSDGAQAILTPPSMSSPVVLRFYVPDGAQVKAGDDLLRIDAGTAAAQLQDLQDKIATTRAQTDKDVADLELKRVDAQMALLDAHATSATAAVDADIPRQLLSALDYDKYQGTAESARRAERLKQADLDAARAAVARRRHDGDLQAQKLELQLGFFQGQVDAATVKAEHDGVVIHDFQTGFFRGGGSGRYEEGSTVYPGNKVGEVVAANGTHSVRAWALAPDRRDLKVGQAVRLIFDALPGKPGSGRIASISNATDAKPEWGDGRYYVIDITLDAATANLPLLPGMNVRVDTATDTGTQPAAHRHETELRADGEIYARSSQAISPPEVEGLWQMNVTAMAPDGAPVHKGDALVTFAGGDLAQKLPATRSELAEKQRTQEQLRLELADRARTTALATAQARADAEKAQRKASQPKDYLPGVEYAKLVIDRERTEAKLLTAQERERIDATARTATQRLADLETAQLRAKVERMQAALATLTVTAPSAGIFVHRTAWDGDKIDTGSQVWRGMSVGEIPDMTSLAVRATLPARDLGRVRLGQDVRVLLNGGGGSLSGRIDDIGRSVHSKSRVEPVPVIDLRIAIDAKQRAIKPGQSVQVEFPAAAKVAAR